MADDERGGRSPVRFDRRQVATVAAAILLVWFAVANWQRVGIHFWIVSAHASLTVVIAVSAALGGFVVWVTRRRARAGRARD